MKFAKFALSGVAAAGLAFAAFTAIPTFAKETTVMVGGAPMFPTKNIIQNAVNSKDHTTLVAAVKAAGLVDTLQGKGPFTVFAPTNDAFAKLPAGTVDTLLKPENKGQLTQGPDLPRRSRSSHRQGSDVGGREGRWQGHA
jgi:uncharacterized surface protein with fasciclin (FAS1) repeats